jgi:Leucine-rich repeat (LRR) protein
MDFSKANNLSPLSNLNNLTELSFNNTPVQSINPIGHLPKLQIIWCNNIVAPIDNILAFINDNPKTTVIFNTEEMETWWNILTPYWKEYFSGRIGFYGNPTERELSAITAINYIDISARKTVTDISCFNKIFMLKQLNASLSGITSLVSLANLPYLEKININFTDIQDVSPLDHLPRLDTLLANNTKIKNISALSKLPTLRLVECDNTGITDNEVKTVYNNNLYCLVVYKTESNINWWTTLSPEWKRNLTGDETTPDKYSLQKILNRKKIDIGDYRGIYNLYPVTSFFYLQKLIIRGSSVNDLAPISQIKTLTYLDLSNTPVLDITPIASLELIDTLRMENTQLKKYDVVGQLKNLKFLDVSGTQIKDLKPLSSLTLLEELVCNNTSVSTLKPLETLPELKRVKAFRTKISERTMKDFTTKKPYCEVIYY